MDLNNKMDELEEKLRAASDEDVVRITENGIITPFFWTLKENRSPEVEYAFQDLLESLKNSRFGSLSWERLYEFFIVSHRSKRIGSRLSVCEFADRLRLAGIKEPGFFAGLYGAAMQLLEHYDGEKDRMA